MTDMRQTSDRDNAIVNLVDRMSEKLIENTICQDNLSKFL